MGFLEQRFPEGISYGSVSGPGFETKIIELDSGQTQRIRRRNQSRRRFNVSERIKTLAQMNEIRKFFLAVGGSSNGFRFKDWADYTTASDDVASPSYDDFQIGEGDGSETDFQLIKDYTEGVFNHRRTIRKPVSSTTRVSLYDTSHNELPATVGGTPYTFSTNTATGVVTISPAPANTLEVWAGCEFDVPVAFDEQVDEWLQTRIDFFEGGDIPDIPLVEELDPEPVSDQGYYGGAKYHGTITATISISESDGRLHVVVPNASGLKVKLPQTDNLALGGPWFAVYNSSGTYSIDMAASDGTSFLTLPSGGNLGEAWLGLNASAAKVWIGK